MKQQEAQPLQEHRGASCYRHRAGAHGGLRDGLDPRGLWGEAILTITYRKTDQPKDKRGYLPNR